jgi:hypothetical protein
MRANRRAFVLLLVLIVIAFLSLGAYSFTDMMLAQHDAAIQYGRQATSRSLVESGAAAVQMFLSLTEQERTSAGGLFDNTERFQGVTVIDSPDPADRGCYSVLAPNIDSSGNLSGVRHGLEDESTRLNLNTLLAVDKLLPGAGKTFLMALPGMTEDIADSIMDWLDADDEPRELGAEIDYYSGLSPPYGPKNGPLETVEELLLIRGVTPQLLFGADINRNGQLDPSEGAADADPAAFRGWSAFLTLHSLEWNVTPEGQPRIYINNNDLKALHEQLLAVFPEEWADFIIAYRQMGPYTGTTAVSTGTAALNLELPAKQPLVQVLDLVGATVRYTQSGSTNVAIMESPFGDDLGSMGAYMPKLMDYVTVNPAATIPGRININQAPATILNGIPGMTPEIAEQIISSRDPETTENEARRHETWLMQEGIVTAEEMKTMMPFVTCGGDVYRGQVVGYFQSGAASCRAEIIFDATTPLPRILFWRDISHLGRGYAVETLGVDFTE